MKGDLIVFLLDGRCRELQKCEDHSWLDRTELHPLSFSGSKRFLTAKIVHRLDARMLLRHKFYYGFSMWSFAWRRHDLINCGGHFLLCSFSVLILGAEILFLKAKVRQVQRADWTYHKYNCALPRSDIMRLDYSPWGFASSCFWPGMSDSYLTGLPRQLFNALPTPSPTSNYTRPDCSFCEFTSLLPFNWIVSTATSYASPIRFLTVRALHRLTDSLRQLFHLD